MAISDYAQIVFDKNGQVIPDCSFKIGRLTFDPYKSWLYVQSKQLWKPKESFIFPTIAKVTEGEIDLIGINIQIKPVELQTKRGIPYDNVKLFKVAGPKNQIFVGILCYAYLDYERHLARQNGIPDDWDVYMMTDYFGGKIKYYIDCCPPNWYKSKNCKSKKIEVTEKQKHKMGINAYCGITKDMIDVLVNWLDWDNIDDDIAKKIKQNKEIKYQNQGDRVYFGGEGVTVGEKNTPIFHEIIKNTKIK